MTTVEESILQTLVELENKVKEMATANPKPNLLPIFAKLDELAAQLPKGANPELLHFLQRKSFQKARLLLEGQAHGDPPGSCQQP